MNKNIAIRFLVVLPVLALLAFVTAVADLGALAQNSNSSTPEDAALQEGNENGNMGTTRRRGRRGRRGRAARAVDPSESPEMTTPSGGGAQDTGVTSPGEATDLSGTYTGRVRMTGAHEMSGEGTLTISGNTFTLEAGGMTHNGRIIAITTRGYTGATLWFTDITDSTTNTPVAAGVRVRRGRNNITMTPVPGSRNRFWFNGRAG